MYFSFVSVDCFWFKQKIVKLYNVFILQIESYRIWLLAWFHITSVFKTWAHRIWSWPACGCVCLSFIDHYVYGYDFVMINVLRSCITFEILTNITKIEMNFNDLQNKMGHWKKLKHHWRKQFVFVVIIIFSLRLFVYSHIRPQFQSICSNIIFLKLSCHQNYGNLEKLVFQIF